MEIVVFIPGIMGSELYDGDKKIWPGPILQILLPYKYERALSKPDLRVGDVIRRVGPARQYNDLIDDLALVGFNEDNGRLVLFPYDWRRDIAETARQLAIRLRELVAIHGNKLQINLIGHSMGGLVARYLLEAKDDPDLDTSARARVARLITLGTPHRGAVEALCVVKGLQRKAFLSASQVQRLASNPRFPAAYQLLPAPGEPCVWSDGEVGRSQPADIYDSTTVDGLELVAANMAAARRFHASLDPTRATASTRYFAFYGTRHKTVSHVQIIDDGDVSYSLRHARLADAGDGTVPVWSGLLSGVQGLPVGGEHQRLFRDSRLRSLLGALLGRPNTLAAELGKVSLSLADGVVDVTQAELGVSLDLGRPTETFTGRLWWERGEIGDHTGGDHTGAKTNYEVVHGLGDMNVLYRGPTLAHLGLEVQLPGESGLYRLCFGVNDERLVSEELFIQDV